MAFFKTKIGIRNALQVSAAKERKTYTHLLEFLRINIKKNLLAYSIYIYSCPMKTHHSSGAHSCGISNIVQNCVIYYLGQIQCFLTKISIPVTPLTHDVTSASQLR